MTGPVPPVEWELRRVEAAAELARSVPCQECAGTFNVIAWWPDSDLPRALEVVHDPSCRFAD